jgi:hypothetical protein
MQPYIGGFPLLEPAAHTCRDCRHRPPSRTPSRRHLDLRSPLTGDDTLARRAGAQFFPPRYGAQTTGNRNWLVAFDIVKNYDDRASRGGLVDFAIVVRSHI